MKKTRLILRELEESLTFWEDLFLILRLHEKAEKSKDYNLKRILSGLLNIAPSLKTVVNPEEFRREVYEKNEINPLRFLPTSPEEWLNPVDYARTSPVGPHTLILFPYMIANWLKTKKVFQVDPGIIPLVNPKKVGIRDIFSKKNFLSLLPCDAFIIRFSETLEIEMESLPIIKKYASCIVVRSGNLIDTFWIPDEIESKSIKPEGRELIKKILANKKIRERELRKLKALSQSVSITEGILFDVNDEAVKALVEPACFLSMSFLVDKPYSFVLPAYSPKKECVRIYRDIFKNIPVEYEESNGRYKRIGELVGSNKEETLRINERVRLQKLFFELINGFCYMLSQIQPRNLKPIDDGKTEESEDFSLPLPWNEIPITRVEYLLEDESRGELKISYGSGEKSAHMRRGHWRHYVRKDGTTEKIWIESVMVREDKLKNGDELKGNVTIIREKRVIA